MKRRRKKETEEIYKTIMAENFPKLRSDTKPQVQQGLRLPPKINAKATTCEHIIFNCRKSKIRKKSLKKPEERNTLPVEK